MSVRPGNFIVVVSRSLLLVSFAIKIASTFYISAGCSRTKCIVAQSINYAYYMLTITGLGFIESVSAYTLLHPKKRSISTAAFNTVSLVGDKHTDDSFEVELPLVC